MAFDMFDRPVPGESLTKPLQDDPSTQVPQIDNLYDAFYRIVDTIEKDEGVYGDLMNMIESGVDLETITHVITFGAFSKGLFSPDIAMQLNPHLLIWLFAEAHKEGVLVQDIKIMNFPENFSRGELSPNDVSALMMRKNPDKFNKMQKESATEQMDEFFGALKQSSDGEIGAPPKGEPESFMSMQAPEAVAPEALMPEEMENV
mgnify:FL=1|jgi:hypothetical protein